MTNQQPVAVENALAFQEIAELKDKLAKENCTSKRSFASSTV